MNDIVNWFRRQASNPQVIILAIILIVGFTLVIVAGQIIAPVIAALVIAYVLEGAVKNFQKLKLPRLMSVFVTVSLFLVFVMGLIFGVLPLVSAQAVQFATQIPSWISEGQTALLELPRKYPELISDEQISELIKAINNTVTELGQQVLVTASKSSVVGVITVVIYLILVPILVFFFLKDKQKLTSWFKDLLATRDDGLARSVWEDVDRQMSNYIRGKVWEILIVGLVTLGTFTLFGLQYAVLLSAIVGLSVLIPFVGAAVVTIPVVAVAWFQWGATPEFAYLVIAYFVIQILDGNVLVPWIYSEVVNLHPVAIVVAVLFFGGIWGIWGVFFAIPLATLVQAILTAWPRSVEKETV